MKEEDNRNVDLSDVQADSNSVIGRQVHHSLETNHDPNVQGKFFFQGKQTALEADIIRKRADGRLEKALDKLPSRFIYSKDDKTWKKTESQDQSQLLGSTTFLRSECFVHNRKEDHDQKAHEKQGHPQRNTCRAKRGRALISSTNIPSATSNDNHVSSPRVRLEVTSSVTTLAETSQRSDSGLVECSELHSTEMLQLDSEKDSDHKKNDHSVYTFTSPSHPHEKYSHSNTQNCFNCTYDPTIIEDLSIIADTYTPSTSHASIYFLNVENRSQTSITPTASSVNGADPPEMYSFDDRKSTGTQPPLNAKADIYTSNLSTVSQLNDPKETGSYHISVKQHRDHNKNLQENHVIRETLSPFLKISCEDTFSPTPDIEEYRITKFNQLLHNKIEPWTREGLLQSHKLIHELKIKLLLEGSKVHHGQGADRIFANYWETLGRYLSLGTWELESMQTHRSCTDSDFNGIELVLKSFLRTRKLRVLHNQLVLELMKQVNHTYTLKSIFTQHAPLQWVNHNTVTIEEKKQLNDNISTIKRKDPLERINEYLGISSGTWTASGDIIPVLTHSNGGIHRITATEKRLTSPTAPGLLEISSIFSSASKIHDIKVSDGAIDFLAIAAREWVTILLQGAIACIEQSSLHGLSKRSSDKLCDSNLSADAKRSSVNDVIIRNNQIISPWTLASAIEIQQGNLRHGWERCLIDAHKSLH